LPNYFAIPLETWVAGLPATMPAYFRSLAHVW